MKRTLFLLVISLTSTIYSQDDTTKFIGKWKVINVVNNGITTNCGSNLSKETIKMKLEKEFLGTSIEFLESQKILYRDKKDKLHIEQECFHFLGIQEFKWKLNHENKIALFHDVGRKKIRLKYLKEKLYLNFVGIIFIFEKV